MCVDYGAVVERINVVLVVCANGSFSSSLTTPDVVV